MPDEITLLLDRVDREATPEDRDRILSGACEIIQEWRKKLDCD